MYICMCNGYTDKDIAAAVNTGGAATAEDAYAALGNGFCCGACRDCAEDLVADLTETSIGNPVAARTVLLAAE